MSGLETSHGEDMRRKLVEKGPQILPLTNPQVQASLARVAFPNEAKPVVRWLAEGDYSSRYRAYLEDSARTEEEKQIDITDERALAELFEAIKSHEPETIH